MLSEPLKHMGHCRFITTHTVLKEAFGIFDYKSDHKVESKGHIVKARN
jgi:hypothetical protein